MARPGAVAVIDQGVVSLANFVTGVILARALLPEGFGLYILGLSIVLLMLDLQTTVTTTPYMVFRPQLHGRERAAYLGSTIVGQIALSLLVITAVALGWIALRLGGAQADVSAVLIALLLTVGFILFRDFVRRVCFAHLQPSAALRVDILVTLLQVGGLLLLVWFDAITVTRAFLVIGAAAGAISLGWIVANRRSVAIVPGRIGADLRKNLSFGKWLLMSALVWAATIYIYPWLLVAFHGTGTAGIWAAGLGIMALINPLLLGLQNFLGPRIATDYADTGPGGLRQSVRRAAVVLAAVIGPAAIFVALIGGRLTTVIYGDPFAGNGVLVALLVVNLFISALAFPFSRGLFAFNRADVDFKVNLVAFALMLTVGVTLTYANGAVGAAWGLIISTAVSALLRARAFDHLTALQHA